MKKEVDKTIKAVCQWLQKRAEEETLDYKEISEPIKALAELVSARSTLEEYREDSYQQSDLGEIRSLEVDIDKEILRINGKEVKEKVLVTLPGPEGWPLQRIYNPEQVGECKKIDVSINSKLL